jgi:hypothetical protein
MMEVTSVRPLRLRGAAARLFLYSDRATRTSFCAAGIPTSSVRPNRQPNDDQSEDSLPSHGQQGPWLGTAPRAARANCRIGLENPMGSPLRPDKWSLPWPGLLHTFSRQDHCSKDQALFSGQLGFQKRRGAPIWFLDRIVCRIGGPFRSALKTLLQVRSSPRRPRRRVPVESHSTGMPAPRIEDVLKQPRYCPGVGLASP